MYFNLTQEDVWRCLTIFFYDALWHLPDIFPMLDICRAIQVFCAIHHNIFIGPPYKISGWCAPSILSLSSATLSSRSGYVLCITLLCIRHDSTEQEGTRFLAIFSLGYFLGICSKTLTEIVPRVEIVHWDSVVSDAWKGHPRREPKRKETQTIWEREKETERETENCCGCLFETKNYKNRDFF